MMCFGLKDRRRLKTNHCVIVLLDDTQLVHELHPTSTGQDLLDVVFKHLNLLETSYFGLRYCTRPANEQQQTTSSKQRLLKETCWLDMDKSAIKQLRDSLPMTVYFGVKYYASDPCKLAEEITRYQFFLQCKQDILHARLPITFELAVELFGLAVQSELGDFDPERHLEGYVSEFQFSPQQSLELEQAAAFYHRQLTGQVPATAELNFLERVKWLDLYGCELHLIQYDEGERGDLYALGLNPTGVLVLRNKLKVAQYAWTRIVKTKCQGRCFLMDVIDQTALMDNGQCAVSAPPSGSDARQRFGFRLADKEASRKLRWSIEEHKSFYLLMINSSSQRRQHEAQQLNFGQRFRQSIRSAMSVNYQQHLVAQQEQARLRSSVKSLRQPPQVVRMPSRRYGQSSRSLQRPAFVYQQHQSASGGGGNGLPLVAPPLVPPPPAPVYQHTGAHTMVESQRQQALLMMQQMQHHQQQQQQQQQQQLQLQYNRSQTLRPTSSKDKRNMHYHQQLLMAAALAQNRQQQPAAPLPEISIVPPGQHIVQPSIYRANSVLYGINQLGGKQLNKNDLLIRQQPTMMQQYYAGQQILNKSNRRSGQESPRSTKSAIAPSHALKLASRKLASNNHHHHQQQQQQYEFVADRLPPPPQNYASSSSPRTNRRLARHCRSKSTGENLNLISAQQHQQQMRMLLTTVPPNGAQMSGPTSLPPPDYNSSLPEARQRPVQAPRRLERSDDEKGKGFYSFDSTQRQSQHRAINEKKLRKNQHHDDDDDDYYCSRSDCSSIDELGDGNGGQQRQARFINGQLINRSSSKHQQQLQNRNRKSSELAAFDHANAAQDWNAIKRRHNEFSNGKGLLGQLESVSIGASGKLASGGNNDPSREFAYNKQENNDRLDANNNNGDTTKTGTSNLVKNITNKQATPILLSMAHHLASDTQKQLKQQHQLSNNENNNSKAVQLLNMQRQQLNSASSSDGTNTTTTSGKGLSNSSSSPSSVSSSPKAVVSAGDQQQVKTGQNLHQNQESSTASNNSTTSGYYAGSNSTGPASVDSDTIDLVSSSQQKARRRSIAAHQDDGSRPMIAYGIYGHGNVAASNGGGRLVIGNQNRAKQPQQKFYLGENNIEINNNNNQTCVSPQESKPSSVKLNQQNSGQWSPIEQLQHAPSSLKYVSFDV